MQVNKQCAEALDNTKDGEQLDYINSFLTIQGEGPYVGRPAVFVRLAGCNLQCPYCDTNYTVGREVVPITEIVRQVQELAQTSTTAVATLVVITGGEPFRQKIMPLIRSLCRNGFDVQVETNGTCPLPADWFEQRTNEPGSRIIVCAPKTVEIDPTILPELAALKYVVESGYVSHYDGLPLRCLGYHRVVFRPPAWFAKSKIYVQPLDEKDSIRNEQHTKVAVDSCLRYGYRLGLQMHKIVGLD